MTAGGSGNAGGAAGGLDPANCPIGPADNCCPLLVHGGTDPDCTSLACTNLQASSIITLEDPDGGTAYSMVALGWSGSELMLARTGLRPGATNTVSEVYLERRALDGGIIAKRRFDTPQRAGRGNGSIAFDPQTRNWLYAYSGLARVHLIALDEQGALQWSGGAHTLCDGIDAVIQVDAARGKFFVTGNSTACTGSMNDAVVEGFDATDGGGRLFQFSLGDGANPNQAGKNSAACDLGCRNIFTQWYGWEGGFMRARILDTATPWNATLDAGFSLGVNVMFGGADHTALAFNGTQWFSMVAIGLNANGSSSLRFQRHDGANWVGSPVTMAGQRALPPSAIWTGDGWLIAATTYVLGTSTAYPQSSYDYAIRLYHFAPDGTLRETRLWEDHAYGARLTWAGGRIAMTFVRAPLGNPETRHLVFFGCP